MALEFCDGFDTYTTLTDRWPLQGGSGVAAIQATSGRDGRGACFSNKADPVWIGAPVARRTIGFAFKGSTTSGASIVGLTDGTFDVAILNWNGGGTFSVIRGHDGVLLGTSTATLAANTWAYIEFRYTASLSCASGDVEVRLNGQTILSITAGTATAVSGFLTFSRVGVGSISGGLNAFDCWVDDLVILDASETFWGDVVVEGSVPTGQGNYAQFAPSGAASNYLCVDEVPPDGDTTYVVSNSLNARDTYTFPAPRQAVKDIKAVQVAITARRVGANPVGLLPSFRQGGSDYDRSRIAPGTSYTTALSQYLTNPATGVAWTTSDVAAIEAGIRTTA